MLSLLATGGYAPDPRLLCWVSSLICHPEERQRRRIPPPAPQGLQPLRGGRPMVGPTAGEGTGVGTSIARPPPLWPRSYPAFCPAVAGTHDACHCEPVRTLAWQSVNLAVLRSNVLVPAPPGRTSKPSPRTGERSPRAACGRKSEGSFSAAVENCKDQRKPAAVFGYRKVDRGTACGG